MIQLCTEKEVRDMKKYVKLFFTLMVCFTLSFSLYSVVSALEEPTVTDDSETVVEEIPEDPTLTDEPEETTEITTPEEQILLQNRQLPFLKKKTITRRKSRLKKTLMKLKNPLFQRELVRQLFQDKTMMSQNLKQLRS